MDFGSFREQLWEPEFRAISARSRLSAKLTTGLTRPAGVMIAENL